MFTHLFKLIWNKRKQNFLLMAEMLVSFLVVFAVCTLIVYYYRNYNKPMGFEHENVWVVSYNNTVRTDNNDSLSLFYETLRRTLTSIPQVKEISFTSSNIPFVQNSMQTGLNYNKKNIGGVEMYTVEDRYAAVLNMKVLEGRWFGKQDIAAKYRSIVINARLKEKLFGNNTAVGKLIGDVDDKNSKQVIGVVEDMKYYGDYSISGIGFYSRIDTASFHWLDKILIQVTPNADAAFEGQLYKTIAGYMKNANIEIEHLASRRKNMNNFYLVPMIVLLIVAGFLIINVALGLFGVLWYNINKRKTEIGLRRAVGASGRSVSGQLVGEALILATLSLITGSFFAIQFPLLNVFHLPAGVYITAQVLAIGFIYLLVLLCALYPCRQAAAIYPAVALHEE
ncbi:MAG TPA: ABC transporter permease [Niastella sp.]